MNKPTRLNERTWKVWSSDGAIQILQMKEWRRRLESAKADLLILFTNGSTMTLPDNSLSSVLAQISAEYYVELFPTDVNDWIPWSEVADTGVFDAVRIHAKASEYCEWLQELARQAIEDGHDPEKRAARRMQVLERAERVLQKKD